MDEDFDKEDTEDKDIEEEDTEEKDLQTDDTEENIQEKGDTEEKDHAKGDTEGKDQDKKETEEGKEDKCQKKKENSETSSSKRPNQSDHRKPGRSLDESEDSPDNSAPGPSAKSSNHNRRSQELTSRKDTCNDLHASALSSDKSQNLSQPGKSNGSSPPECPVTKKPKDNNADTDPNRVHELNNQSRASKRRSGETSASAESSQHAPKEQEKPKGNSPTKSPEKKKPKPDN